MVTMLTREREARGEGIITKVGSNLPEKIFVARKLFKNCLTLSDLGYCYVIGLSKYFQKLNEC